jgi:hypothetical protein
MVQQWAVFTGPRRVCVMSCRGRSPVAYHRDPAEKPTVLTCRCFGCSPGETCAEPSPEIDKRKSTPAEREGGSPSRTKGPPTLHACKPVLSTQPAQAG